MIERDGWKDANAFSFSLDMNFLVCFWTEIVYVIKWWKRHRIWITIFFFLLMLLLVYLFSIYRKSNYKVYQYGLSNRFWIIFLVTFCKGEKRRKKKKKHISFEVPSFFYTIQFFFVTLTGFNSKTEKERWVRNNEKKITILSPTIMPQCKKSILLVCYEILKWLTWMIYQVQ